MRKYFEVLIGTLKTFPELSDSTVESSEETKARMTKDKEVKIKNNIGYMELLMAMTDKINFTILDEAKTDEFPSEDLVRTWNALLNSVELLQQH